MNDKILYLECASGISGDIFCGALLDLGASPEKLRQVFDSLNVPGFHWHFDHVDSHGLRAGSFQVHIHDHDHGHDHEHEHEHHHHHEHRNLEDVLAIISRGVMSDRAKTLARAIFTIVAEAEAKVHGKPLNEVHFHEVGALDSIADIIGAAVLFDELGIDKVCLTELSEGHGFVECAHGRLPVPVPAVAEIVRAFRIPMSFRKEIGGEMVTPTGAAIGAALRERFGCSMPEKYTVSAIGLGAGPRDFGVPNVLRAMIVEACPADEETPDTVRQIEVNLDDCSGETVGLAMEKLLQAGALDVCVIPCQMKKNRPAFLLRVLCRIGEFDKIAEVIFRHTTTIGLRYTDMKRLCMERTMIGVPTPFGTIAVKKCSWQGESFCYPEYDSVAAAVERTGHSFAEIHAAARSAAQAK